MNGHTDRRTNRHDEANSRFSQFYEYAKNVGPCQHPWGTLPNFGVGFKKKLQTLQAVTVFVDN
jgi:hypothetical protein